MKKPDPEAFARAMLWNIAGLRAELKALRVAFYAHAAQAGNPLTPEQMHDHDAERIRAEQQRIFAEVTQACGLDKTTDPAGDAPPPKP